MMTQALTRPKSFYFVAGEASGDLLGSEVITALQEAGVEGPFRATGGKELTRLANMSEIDISPLSVFGLWEGLRAYGDATRLAKATAQDIIASGASHVVLVDSWGFCLRVAHRVRAADPSIKLIKLIGPQVWATRAGRAKTLAGAVDHLLCIHDFEVPYYTPYGLDVSVIGHPALSRSAPADGHKFREAHGVMPSSQLVLILPGSRASEIERVGPPLIEAGRRLVTADVNRRVIVAPAMGVLGRFKEQFSELPEDWICLRDDAERFGAMAAADVALACSGTVTSEIAVQGTPFVTGYKTGAVTWTLVKNFLLKADYITLINMAAGRMVAPELLQHGFTAVALAEACERLLSDNKLHSEQIAAQNEALLKMRSGGRAAAELAAERLREL